MHSRPKKTLALTLLAVPAAAALTLSAALTGTAAADSAPAVITPRTGNLICIQAYFNDCGHAPLSVKDPAKNVAVDPRRQDAISSWKPC